MCGVCFLFPALFLPFVQGQMNYIGPAFVVICSASRDTEEALKKPKE